jgi:phosphoenolpyruvate carboxykinase (ATP)
MSKWNVKSNYGLDNHGLHNQAAVFWNLTTPALYEKVIARKEGHLSHMGPILVRTGHHTGRSAGDKFIVREEASQEDIWWGKINKEITEERFDQLHERMLNSLQMKELFVQDCFAGSDPDHRLRVRIINEYAWHNIFARNMFITPPREELATFVPDFTVINSPKFHAIKEQDGTNSETFIVVNFKKRLVLIGGTSYAGETKKSIFSVMNHILPTKGVLPMHCSANISSKGETTLFFGLSGTGKTTLSADASRQLIGDDEHGWADNGTFNFEGGCYAKVIKLSKEAEPEIYDTTRRFGTILENVNMDMVTRRVDLDDGIFTENTRASYPITHIPNIAPGGRGGQPKDVIFLTADAFGVLPPISRLSPEEAMYHFLSGYTAKVAGTERGIVEPTPNFSACYGAPFLPRHPSVYAKLLGERLKKTGAKVWLINTGWSGGAYGTGKRISIKYTRAMINAALDGKLDNVEFKKHLPFNLSIPTSCPDVPSEILDPINTWSDQAAYREQAQKLRGMFAENFEQFETQVDSAVRKVAL